LQNQRFALGDRVIMVQDSGGVPLCAKGVVVGLNNTSIDVLWDVPFVSGTDLGGRCSQYRGSSCAFNACLNLTQPQFVMSTRPGKTPATSPSQPQPRIGPQPAITPRSGYHGASGFRPAPQTQGQVQIMSNPHRGRGGSHIAPNVPYNAALNGRGRGRGRGGANGHIDHLRDTINQGLPNAPHARSESTASVTVTAAATTIATPDSTTVETTTSTSATETVTAPNPNPVPGANGRGGFVPRGFNGRGGYRGRGGFNPNGPQRGGPPTRGYRGRGRGGPPQPVVQSS